jgi:hypothetical protein
MAFTGVMPAGKLIAPRYGLEAGATVVRHGEDDQTWGAGYEQENSLCGIRGETWVWCGAAANATDPDWQDRTPVDLDQGDPTDPDFDPAMRQTELTGAEGESEGRWEQVYPFLVQAEDSCTNTLHAKRPETKEHLLDVLEFLSIKGAERELWAGGTNAGAKALTRQPTSVGTDLKPKAALGAVEEAMAACLPGVMGTVHIPPGLASVLDNSLQDIDGELWTFAGSRVIVGAGYAGQSPGGVGKSAIYGTGPVVVHLGPTSMVTEELAQMMGTTYTVTGTAPNKKKVHGVLNEFHLRAERLVAVTFDGCCHVGATVSLT